MGAWAPAGDVGAADARGVIAQFLHIRGSGSRGQSRSTAKREASKVSQPSPFEQAPSQLVFWFTPLSPSRWPTTAVPLYLGLVKDWVSLEVVLLYIVAADDKVVL